MCSECMVHLKTMFASPPACVFFGRHVYDWHNVPHLDPGETDDQNEVTAERIQPDIMMGSELRRGLVSELPQRSAHLWPELCNAWWRGQQQWLERWSRLLRTPAGGSPCCQSGKQNNNNAEVLQMVLPSSDILQILHASCSCHTVPWSVCHTVC